MTYSYMATVGCKWQLPSFDGMGTSAGDTSPYVLLLASFMHFHCSPATPENLPARNLLGIRAEMSAKLAERAWTVYQEASIVLPSYDLGKRASSLTSSFLLCKKMA